MILKIPIKDTAPSRVNLKMTSWSGFPDYLLSLNIQIYSFSESSISACHFFDHVSGPLKLKLLRGLWPFSFGRQTSWCDWRWSGDVESAEPSDSSLESESDVRSANLRQTQFWWRKGCCSLPSLCNKGSVSPVLIHPVVDHSVDAKVLQGENRLLGVILVCPTEDHLAM